MSHNMNAFVVKAVDYDMIDILGYSTDLEKAEKYVAKYTEEYECNDQDLIIEEIPCIDDEDTSDIETVRYVYDFAVLNDTVKLRDRTVAGKKCKSCKSIGYNYPYTYILITTESKDKDQVQSVASDVLKQYIEFRDQYQGRYDKKEDIINDFNDQYLNRENYIKRKQEEINMLQEQIDKIKEEINT